MIFEIFQAAVHSVGTAATMTMAGVYLHRKGMITADAKTVMARYTQQIAIPCLFFSKIVDCPQNHSEDKCPNILEHLGDAWVLLLWPFYVMAVGLLVGTAVIKAVRPPKWQHKCVLSATAFANAMGMPITLLDVIGQNFTPPGSYNHNLDPSLFQSIYVILNPCLQWGLGGWMLSKEEDSSSPSEKLHPSDSYTDENDDSASSSSYDEEMTDDEHRFPAMARNFSIPTLEDAGFADEVTPLASLSNGSRGTIVIANRRSKQLPAVPEQKKSLGQILSKIASKAMQPPALGALSGFVVAAYGPLRGLFVDLQHRQDNALFEWIFDGVLALGKSAIPVNMVVVGVNLSISAQRKNACPRTGVSNRTIAAVILGKMFFMPCIGIATVWILKSYFWNVPEQIQFQFYLVLLMNFITPTANVVMVIAELGAGPEAKNLMASLIGWQYVVAPFLLSLTVMLVVYIAALQ